MLVLLIFAVWLSPGPPDIVRANPFATLEACETARAEVVAEAARHAHQIDARCIVFKAGQPT